MTLLRDLSRRKLRTTLTIVGITIGIWAFVVFSWVPKSATLGSLFTAVSSHAD